MDLSIIIVNYQTFELTRDTINSILDYDYPFSYEIYVVDNASEDDSLSRLKDYFKDKVKFIASIENNGFAAGNNQALKQANGKYQLLLNSDTVVWENTLENIYNYMEDNPDVGACGCQVLLEDGNLDKACKRSFPNVKNSFFRLFHIPTKSKDDNYNLTEQHHYLTLKTPYSSVSKRGASKKLISPSSDTSLNFNVNGISVPKATSTISLNLLALNISCNLGTL